MADDREALARRQRRQRRLARMESTGSRRGFFASPQSALVCMVIALAAVLAFWGGAPRWVLLAIGIGAVVVVVLGAALWRARRKSGEK